MAIVVHVSQLGSACLPEKFAAAVSQPIRLFAFDRDTCNQAQHYLRNGGSVALAGAWRQVDAGAAWLYRREAEILPRQCGQQRQALRRRLRQRILTLLEPTVPYAGALSPEIRAGLLGERQLPAMPVLLPVAEATVLRALPQSTCCVPSIGAELLVHPDVLAPRSPQTIQLMVDAIRIAATGLPPAARILDMGCGSGVLTIAALQILQDASARVFASDVLPEALALTHLNVERLARQGRIAAARVHVEQAGNLFERLENRAFDLIIFNAPWVTAPAHNRAELALNDAGQETLCRFLRDCPRHLRPGGQVIVGYADNSGPRAIAGLERLIAAAGLMVAEVRRDRIKTYRSRRAWQNIQAYRLVVR